MKKILLGLVTASAALALYFNHSEPSQEGVYTTPPASIEGRAEYELQRLADPQTGEIPDNMRAKELGLASTLPMHGAARGELALAFESIGPFNVGGRTRAFAFDKSDANTFLAGGVSGGMWKSIDAGNSWYRTTTPQQHAATSCIIQDPRAGNEDVWYYGSGEVVGNSASKSFSAYYRGNGLYKSTDGGESWTSIASTTAIPHKSSTWDAVFRVYVDPNFTNETVLLVALESGIYRSTDDGQNWTAVLGGNLNAEFTDLIMTKAGVYYAAIAPNQNGSEGFWRSTDGINWTEITTPSFPNNHERTVMAIPAINENIVYFFSGTPNAGVNGYSLWRYDYVSGDGSGTGGTWENRSASLPSEALSLQGGYSQIVAVKPDDPDYVLIGGTNLYRSTNGFIDTNQISHIGGYRVDGDDDFSFRSGIHYPDQQSIAFDQTDTKRMISTTDGGIHRTQDCTAPFITWERLSRGYVTSQFYGIGIDHETVGSEEVMGGLQDRGTFWTNEADASVDWVSVRGADGAYVWIEDGGEHHYMSTQYANIQRSSVNDSGEVNGAFNIMPESLDRGSSAGWLFVHPFTLDPADNNIMYLPYRDEIWRNSNLAGADDEDLSFWSKVTEGSGTITAIAASQNPQGVVYWGTSNRAIYKMTDGHLPSATPAQLISDSITNGAYTSCIAIDPADADKVIVVYSNYNTISLWYSENGGVSWTDIEGNLKGNPDEGVPEDFTYIGDGPSIRWAEIAPTEGGNVYFIGTSIGMFSTREINGDSTVWKQEGANTIGNVVVDMIDYRAADQWLVVGTHGNGIYAANVDFVPSVGIKDEASSLDWSIYPNPTTDRINLKFDLKKATTLNIQLFDQAGRALKTMNLGQQSTGVQTLEMNLEGWAPGIYYCRIEGDGIRTMKKIVKE